MRHTSEIVKSSDDTFRSVDVCLTGIFFLAQENKVIRLLQLCLWSGKILQAVVGKLVLLRERGRQAGVVWVKEDFVPSWDSVSGHGKDRALRALPEVVTRAARGSTTRGKGSNGRGGAVGGVRKRS